MNLEEVARRFEATRSGAGFMARCPAHEDDRASLGISQENGKVLLHCFAGCVTDAILRAKKLTMKDLFNGQQQSTIVATYDYCDVNGTLRYQKRRTADKRFFFARPDDRGGWITSAKQNGNKPVMQGVGRLLYRLHELRKFSEGSVECIAYIVEGEKDADRLWSLGLPATTNDAGASEDGQKPKWSRALTQQLKACGVTSVVCLPDNDAPGRAHMQAVAEGCMAAGIEARILDLPDLPEKGDVSDWLNAGHGVAELWELAAAAVPYAPPPPAPAAPEKIVTHARTLDEVHAVFKRWLGDEYEIDALHAVLAAAAAEQMEGDPLWLLLISGPGGGKTETVQSLSGVGAITVSTIASEGALLSASPKRERTKDATGGLLLSVGPRGIVVIKDVTSILSMQHNTRQGVLAALREIHDGCWVRNVGTDGGKTLTWTGRLVIIGACTTAWDAAHSVISTMGDRFVLLRMNSRDGRMSAGRHAIGNTGQEAVMRRELAEAVAGLLGAVDPRGEVALTDGERDQVLAAADITTLCRTGVEYDYRGDASDAHMPEMPTRFAKQLTQIIRGGRGIGMTHAAAMLLAIRCARDSMPPLRLAILTDLWAHPRSQVTEIRARLNMPYATVKRQVDSLHLLQVLTCEESVGEHEEKIEVESGTPTKTRRTLMDEETPTKTKRTLKKRTVRRFCVDGALRAAALGLGEAMDEPGNDQPPF